MRKEAFRCALPFVALAATLLPNISHAQAALSPPIVSTQITPCCGVTALSGPTNAGDVLTYTDTLNGVSAQATTSLGSVTIPSNASASLTTRGLDISALATVEYSFTLNPTAMAPTGSLEYFDVSTSGSVSGSTPTVSIGSQTTVGSAMAYIYYTDGTTSNYTIQNELQEASTQLALNCVSGSFTSGCSVTGENNPSGASSFSSPNLRLPVDVGDTVTIEYGAIVRSSTLNPANFSATLDPLITLDPSDTAGLTIQFSPGVIQPVPTPLPGAALLLLSGFGGIAGIARGRRKRP
jgi:hypothetical protein